MTTPGTTGASVTDASTTDASKADVIAPSVLEAMIAALPHGVSVYGPDRRLVMFNDAYARIMEGAPITVGEHMSDILRRFAESGELGPGDPTEFLRIEMGFQLNRPQMRQRVRPNGTVLDVRTAPLPDGGHLSVITDITAIFRAEEEARNRSAVLETMLGTMRHGVMLFGSDRRLIAANQLAARLAGHEPDDLVPGTLHNDLVQRQFDKGEFGEGAEAQALLGMALYRDRTIPSRHTRRGTNGRILEIAFDPTADGGFVISYADITPLAHAEEEAQQRAEIQRYMLDNLRVGVQMYDADGRLLAFNALAETLAGLPHGALRTGRLIDDIFREAARSGHLDPDHAERVLKEDHSTPLRYRQRRADGTILDVRSDPTPDGGFVVALTDVTQLAKAETEAERRSQMMQAMLDNIRHGIVLFDAEGRVLAANALASSLTGLPAETPLEGLTIAELGARQAETGEISADEKLQFDNHRASTTMLAGRYERTRSNGMVLTVTTDPTPGGGFVRTYADVTEDHRIRAELETARAAAEGTSLANTRLIASLMDKMHAKLTVIVRMSEALQADAASAAAAEPARAILRASQDLLTLVNGKTDRPS